MNVSISQTLNATFFFKASLIIFMKDGTDFRSFALITVVKKNDAKNLNISNWPPSIVYISISLAFV